MREIEASKAINLLSLSWHWEQRQKILAIPWDFLFSASPHFSISL